MLKLVLDDTFHLEVVAEHHVAARARDVDQRDRAALLDRAAVVLARDHQHVGVGRLDVLHPTAEVDVALGHDSRAAHVEAAEDRALRADLAVVVPLAVLLRGHVQRRAAAALGEPARRDSAGHVRIVDQHRMRAVTDVDDRDEAALFDLDAYVVAAAVVAAPVVEQDDRAIADHVHLDRRAGDVEAAFDLGRAQVAHVDHLHAAVGVEVQDPAVAEHAEDVTALDLARGIARVAGGIAVVGRRLGAA
jgi:hypothetical protein